MRATAAAAPRARAPCPPRLASSPTVTPPEVLLVKLAAHRVREDDFADAWPRAVGVALGGLTGDAATNWSIVLDSTRPAWEAAFEGRSARRREQAVSLLGQDCDVVDRDARYCAECHAPIPAARTGNARFCCDPCRRRWHYRKEAERRVAAA